MSTRERILAIKLLEKQDKNPDYIRKMGIQVKMVKKISTSQEGKTCLRY